MKNPHAVALGKKGGKAGTGPAKARTSEQARAAVMDRWARRKRKASARRQNAEVSDGGPLTHNKPAAQSRRSLH